MEFIVLSIIIPYEFFILLDAKISMLSTLHCIGQEPQRDPYTREERVKKRSLISSFWFVVFFLRWIDKINKLNKRGEMRRCACKETLSHRDEKKLKIITVSRWRVEERRRCFWCDQSKYAICKQACSLSQTLKLVYVLRVRYACPPSAYFCVYLTSYGKPRRKTSKSSPDFVACTLEGTGWVSRRIILNRIQENHYRFLYIREFQCMSKIIIEKINHVRFLRIKSFAAKT